MLEAKDRRGETSRHAQSAIVGRFCNAGCSEADIAADLGQLFRREEPRMRAKKWTSRAMTPQDAAEQAKAAA